MKGHTKGYYKVPKKDWNPKASIQDKISNIPSQYVVAFQTPKYHSQNNTMSCCVHRARRMNKIFQMAKKPEPFKLDTFETLNENPYDNKDMHQDASPCQDFCSPSTESLPQSELDRELLAQTRLQINELFQQAIRDKPKPNMKSNQLKSQSQILPEPSHWQKQLLKNKNRHKQIRNPDVSWMTNRDESLHRLEDFIDINDT